MGEELGSGQADLPSTRASGPAGKLLVPVLGILTVLAIGAASAMGYLFIQERDKRQAKEHELQAAVTQGNQLKAKLDEVQQAKDHADEELTRVSKELGQAKEDLAKAAEVRETLASSIEDREKEIARLTKSLEQAQTDSKQITSQLTDLQSERDKSKKQLVDLQKAKSELESKVIELSGQPTVELEKIRVGSDQSVDASGKAVAMPVSALSGVAAQGQVVVVNREYDFVVVNMGRNRGLSIGQEFKIIRGEEVLGKVKVEKVYDELSAAAILPESQKNNIREGDSVRAL